MKKSKSREIFDKMAEEFFYARKNIERMKPTDMAIIYEFLDQNDSLTVPHREMRINRLFMDNPKKPKNWPYILELLSWTNSRILRIEQTEKTDEIKKYGDSKNQPKTRGSIDLP